MNMRNAGCWALAGWLSAAACLNAGPQAAPSQVPEDPFGWGYYTFDGEADLTEEIEPGHKAAADSHEVEGALSMPYYEREDLMLLAGAGYKWNHFSFSGVALPDYDLNTLTLPLDALYSAGADWTFWVNVTPGLYTDFHGVDGDDYRTAGLGLASVELNPRWGLALGAAYDRVFGDDKLYPLGGFRWTPNGQWAVDLVLPMPRVTYAPTRKLALFMDARPAGDKWNLREEGENYDFQLESYRVGAGLEYALTCHVWLHVAAGGDLDRNYEIRNQDRKLLDSGVEDTYFVRAGLVLR